MRHTGTVVRGPLLLLLLSVVLGAGALVAGVSAQHDPGAPGPAAPTVPSPTAQPTPLPVTPVPAPRVSPTARARSAKPLPAPVTLPRPSRAAGRPFRAGRLVDGVQFPVSGPDHLTWDGVLRRVPNRPWRRWGTDTLVATVLRVLAEHRAANPGAPPVLVGDLSLPRGGPFGPEYGGLGHASHQNGLDVDVYYPRRDRAPVEARTFRDVDRRLSQDLVDRFLAAGAELVVVGHRVGLRGPRARVIRLDHHDDHLHVRIPDPDGIGPRRR